MGLNLTVSSKKRRFSCKKQKVFKSEPKMALRFAGACLWAILFTNKEMRFEWNMREVIMKKYASVA